MFCYKQDGIAHKIFNKQFTEDEYNSILDNIDIDFEKVARTNHAEVMEAYEDDRTKCH